MKPFSAKLTACFLLLTLLFASCSKEPIKPMPPDKPGTPDKPSTTTALFRFAASINLTGEPYHTSNLHAVVSIANEKNEPVITDTMLTLALGAQVVTDPVRLPVGKYKLTSFRMVYGTTYTHFAAPIAGSAKAAQVQKPLAISFNIQQSEQEMVPVEVLKVADGERPAVFGYPAGSFDNNQSENSPYATIKIKAEIRVGDVLYNDSRASLALTSYSTIGERTTSYIGLKPGINEVSLLKAANRYTLTVSKWGTYSDLSLSRGDLDRDTVYTFSTSRAPKVLQAELIYKLIDNKYEPDTKKTYVYDAAGKLTQVQYIFRQADGTNLNGIYDQLAYENGLVSKLSRYDEKGAVQSATSFSYDAAQRVTGISHQAGNETITGTVSYLGTPATGMGIHHHVSTPGYSYDIHHSKAFGNGNIISDESTKATHQRENGSYDFDDQINPYYFLGLPDLYLTNQNKNNITNQYMTYIEGHPEAVPYKSEYTYDADGYPTQVLRHYKSYQGGTWAHAYTAKIVYQYRT